MLNPRETFQAMAVRVLRKHRYCGDAYPEDGWPEVNAALAQYAAEKRHVKQYDALMRRLRRRQKPHRLTCVRADGCAGASVDSESNDSAAAAQLDR